MYWFSRKKKNEPSVPGLILPGGGARNAYQAGVLRAITEILPADTGNPFPVICGTSSGALNAAVLASHAMQFSEGVSHLTGIWENFSCDKVFYSDPWSALKSGLRWSTAFVTASLGRSAPRSLLDNSPQRAFIESHIRLARIQQAIDSGALRALAVTASSYSSGHSICYFQGMDGLQPWQRTRRLGVSAEISIDHLMASSAIPLIFPAVWLNNEYHGDGSMRESAPLSPALHLGANRLLIIGVRNTTPDELPSAGDNAPYPTIGQITGYMLDSLFMDSLDSDIERMNRINDTISETPDKRVEFKDTTLRPIEFLTISPSKDVREIAQRHATGFPRSVRLLLKTLGALTQEGRPLVSYLLFEPGFCREMLELGYQDGLAAQADIKELLLSE
ncbi:MAG: patatin-like phospholipase family protein [Gammaproteobacteria bacterium]|nr:MAG: patatin-like phospholipase family protein [Gammaproteobacteria bacterium]